MYSIPDDTTVKGKQISNMSDCVNIHTDREKGQEV